MSELETKTLTELRGIAEALGIAKSFGFWGWDRLTLIRKISSEVAQSVETPKKSDEPSDARLRNIPPARNLSQKEVAKALDKFIDRGLIYTFPTPDTIRLTKVVVREDTCSLRTHLRVLVECAKKICND